MNRPFYALGVLLAFLALAMLAIGLSSRPKHHPPSASGGGSGIPSPRPAWGPSLYVLVLPDDDCASPATEEYAVYADLCGRQSESPSYEEGCGLDRATGEVYSHGAVASCPLATGECCPPRRAMQAAAIEMAIDPSQRSGMDYLSHYDAVYDAAMTARAAPAPLAAGNAAGSDLDAESQLLALFRSFNPPAPLARHARRWDYEANSMVRGILNRVWRAVQSTDSDDGAGETDGTPATRRYLRTMNLRSIAPTWTDYESWIESQQPTVAHSTKSDHATPFWRMPKRQVLQIAVSALNRVAELLHQAVVQMIERTTERVAGRGQIGGGWSAVQ